MTYTLEEKHMKSKYKEQYLMILMIVMIITLLGIMFLEQYSGYFLTILFACIGGTAFIKFSKNTSSTK